MPRRTRHFKTDSIFHLGCRGVDRQPIFLLDSDREFFLAAMDECIRASSVRTVAYCLMPNHFHWAIATADTPFDKVLHGVLTRHAVRFNMLHGRTGHLFEARHWSSLCEDIEHVENAIAYIHINPVRARLVRRPEEWRWSSYGYWTSNDAGPVDFARISAICGQTKTELMSNHRSRVETTMEDGPKGMDIEALLADTASALSISASALRSGARGIAFTLAKRIIIKRAEAESIGIEELARGLNCTKEAIYMIKSRHN